MNHVAAPVAGVVTAILVENGAAVEFGQPLVVVDPRAERPMPAGCAGS